MLRRSPAIGNQASLRLVKHDAPAAAEPAPAPEPTSEPTSEPAPMPATEPAAPTPDQAGGTGGTIPDIRTPPGQGRSTSDLAADPASPQAMPVVVDLECDDIKSNRVAVRLNV